MSGPAAPADGDPEHEAVLAHALEQVAGAAEQRRALLGVLRQALEAIPLETDSAARFQQQLDVAKGGDGGASEANFLSGLMRRLNVVDARRRLERLALGKVGVGVALRNALDRLLLRDVGPALEVRGKDVVWRSNAGPRRHELVLPSHRAGDLAWLRSKAHAQHATGPRRLAGLLLGARELGTHLQEHVTLTETAASSWPADVVSRLPDFFLVDISVGVDAGEVLGKCEELGVLPVLWVSEATEAATAWPAWVPRCAPHILFSPSAEIVAGGPASQAEVRTAHLLRRWQRVNASSLAVSRRFATYCGLPPIGPPLPKVSVLCVSNRPERWRHCLAAFDRQSYPHKELVYVANLDRLPVEMMRQLELRTDVVVLRTSSGHSLGESLNRARAAASGELWTKMDDDDHYGARYLADLVDVLLESGADVVGKGTFYTYVQTTRALYLTREGPEDARSERYLQGGTILADRASVDGIDFPPVRRGTDTLFLQQCKLLGLHIHSADRFNYAYVRYDDVGHHTFDVSTARYLKKSELLGESVDVELVDL